MLYVFGKMSSPAVEVMDELKLRKQVLQLEAKLLQVTQERDDLQADVERLCMQATGGSRVRSSLVKDKLSTMEAEVKKARATATSVQLENLKLREDYMKADHGKFLANKELQDLKVRAVKLEEELSFYQSQSAKVISERDRLAYDVEDLSSQNLHLEKSFQDSQNALASESLKRQEAESQLASTRVDLSAVSSKLEASLLVSSRVPELEQNLAQAQRAVERLNEEKSAVQVALRQAEDQLREVQHQLLVAETNLDHQGQALQQLQHDAKVREGEVAAEQERMYERIAQLHAGSAALGEELAEVRGGAKADAAAALDRQMEEEKEREKLLVQIRELQVDLGQKEANISSLQEEVNAVAREKLKALLEVEDREKAMAEVEQLNDLLEKKVTELKIKLAQAAEEKVVALLRVAAGSSGGDRDGNRQHGGQGGVANGREPHDRSLSLGEGLGAAHDGSQERVDPVELRGLAVSLEQYRGRLEAVGAQLWDGSDGRKKAEGLQTLAKLTEEVAAWNLVGREREDVAADQDVDGGLGAVRGQQRSKGGTLVDILRREGLGLVQFGVSALREVNKQSAYVQLLDF